VLRTQDALLDTEGAFEGRAGLLVLAEITVDTPEVGERPPRTKVVRSQGGG
jgi:hypothetical protein